MDRDDIKEEIKRRADIVEIVSRYVNLQRAGSRMRARCPFHEETEPSFYVDPAGSYYCFGCQAGGDVFSFLMQIEGLSFPEAAERLAEMVGLQWRPSPDAQRKGQQRDIVRRVNEMAAYFFAATLASADGAPAREYLHGRGIDDDAIKRFNLGYAPDEWDRLVRYLAGKGVSGRIAEHCGLVKARETGGHYDAFRNRVMFPILDVGGRPIAFGGRTLDPEENAKYINSPETALFKKSRTVYGLNLARQAISREGRVMVVEGYTDVISVSQAGIENVVACLGTATTADHLRLLSRYTDEIVFVYDADAAGMKAALRHIETFEQAAAAVKVAVLPAGKDPDETIREFGADGFRQAVAEAVGLVEYQLRMVFEYHRDQQGTDRAAAARDAVAVLAKVSDRARRDELLRIAADWWGEGNPARTETMARLLNEELQGIAPLPGGRRPFSRRLAADRSFITATLTTATTGIPPALLKLEGALLSAALDDEITARRLAVLLEPEDLVDARDAEVFRTMLGHLHAAGAFDGHAVIDALPDDGGVRLRGLELLMREVEKPPEANEVEADARKLTQYRSVRDFDVYKREVLAALEKGELTPDDPRYLEFTRRQAELQSFGLGGDGLRRYEPGGAACTDDDGPAPSDVGGAAPGQPDEETLPYDEGS